MNNFSSKYYQWCREEAAREASAGFSSVAAVRGSLALKSVHTHFLAFLSRFASASRLLSSRAGTASNWIRSSSGCLLLSTALDFQ
jgi:hypothetical protein